MAYIQRTTPSPNKILEYTISDFSGGLNNASDLKENNQASDMNNLMFSDDSLIENRYGQKRYDDVTLAEAVIYLDEYKPYNAEDIFVKATATKVYFNNVFKQTVEGKIVGCNHMGKYFFVDGSKMYVYGKFGQVTSTYENVIGTPVNDYVVMEIVSPDIAAVRLDTSHVRGVLNVDYTLKKVYYVPCENEFIDPYKSANVIASGFKYLVNKAGRLYASGNSKDDDNIFITDVNNPYYFPVSLPIQVPPNSDTINGLAVYDDAIVVGRQRDIHVIKGATNNPSLGFDVFNLRKLNTHTGFINHESVQVVHNYLIFLGGDGKVYAMSSSQYDENTVSTAVISKQIDLFKEPISLTLTDLTSAVSIFFEDNYYLSVNNVVLIYSYKNRAWVKYTGLYAESFYNIDSALIWGRGDGYIAMFDKDVYKDFGEPYEAYWVSKLLDMGEPTTFKHFRDFFIVAKTFKDYSSDVRITFEIDYDDVENSVSINNKMSIWGESVWGDRFITRNINASEMFVIGRRGRNAKIKIRINYDLSGEVSTYADLANYLNKANGMLVYVIDTSTYYLYDDYIWHEMSSDKLNQRMKMYELNGTYEFRGKR